MNLLTLRRFAATVFCLATGACTLLAQDMIAEQAPIDRKLKAVDSVALQRLIDKHEKKDYTSLYSSWNNDRAHCYASSEVPDSFKIDLRGFAMPTPSRRVTSNFGYRASFRRMHKGLDIKVYTGDTICAAFDGKVRVVKYDAGGYGYYVLIRHTNGLETIYGHLSKQLVAVDQEVKAGEPIGLGGNTGRSYGSHLHFETRLLGEAIDPALMFDFEAQDVTADYYVFRSSKSQSTGSSTLASRENRSDGNQSATRMYQVKRGDSINSIARRLGTTVDHLCDVNNLSRRSKIRPKQILKY